MKTPDLLFHLKLALTCVFVLPLAAYLFKQELKAFEPEDSYTVFAGALAVAIMCSFFGGVYAVIVLIWNLEKWLPL